MPIVTLKQMRILGMLRGIWRLVVRDGQATIENGDISEAVHPLLMSSLKNKGLIMFSGGEFVLSEDGIKAVEGNRGE